MFQLEKKIKKTGFKNIAGLDEAGRGALAGPVVAAAVLLDSGFRASDLKSLKKMRDSKKMTKKGREEVYKELVSCPGIVWDVRVVSWKIIDRVNILNATKIAMRRAVKKISVKPDYLLIDGNFGINSGIKELSVIRGDETVFSCMSAGIIAKVSRDRIMEKYSSRYIDYQFGKNKGYGTLYHRKAIKKYGPCSIHRMSFKLL